MYVNSKNKMDEGTGTYVPGQISDDETTTSTRRNSLELDFNEIVCAFLESNGH